jgi:prolyl oligopeptidase
MPNRRSIPRPRALLLLPALLAAPLAAQNSAMLPAPPPTRRDAVVDRLHGVDVPDPYRWLEDQDAPETRAWIDAQNAHTERVLSAIPGREALRARLTELLKIDSIGTPTAIGDRKFYFRRRADQELAVLYTRKGRAKEAVLLDPHPLSPDHTTGIGVVSYSPDGTLLAYSVREGGKDEVEIRLLDVETRKELPDRLPSARYFGVALKPDRSGFYYSRFGAEGSRVYYHAMGTDPKTDRLIFGEGLTREKIVGISLSDSGHYLVLNVFYGSAAEKSDLYVLDLRTAGPVRTIVNDLPANFSGDIGGDTLFVQTDWNAPNRRILAVDLRNPGAPSTWREVVPTSRAIIQGFALAGGRLFVNSLDQVRSRVEVYLPDGQRVGEITFPTLGSVSAIQGRWEQDEAFFSFSSYTVPTTIYRYQAATGRKNVWARVKVPVDTAALEVRQVWFTSRDGTRVPMFLAHKKGLKRDGARPVFLTGYGGFNSSLTPSYSAVAALWAERGGVYAVPNLRGGGEFGEEWHRAAMREKKQNTFDDFIAAAEWLVSEKYTRPDKLAINGGSNGGLLVGAALTQRPELFRAVLCTYPLLDMVRYHQFLVARFWVPEYGSSEDPALFPILHGYSPYHRVKPGTRYPAVLFVTGDADTRVAPLHARKMAALLQAATGSSDRPVLLDYDTKAGHAGAKPLSKAIEDLTQHHGFLLWQLEGGK